MPEKLPTLNDSRAVSPESLPVPIGKTEKRELRSTHSKTFLHAEKAQDGKEIRTCRAQIGAVCYRSDTGELRSIDTTIRDLGDGNIGVEWAPYKFRLHETGIGFDFQSREGGNVTVTLSGIGGEKFDSTVALTPDITDNAITFRDVRPGCDIVFQCLNQRVKTLRLLRDAHAPRSFEWAVVSDKPELIDSTLIGTDAAGNPLELVATVNGAVVTETWTGKAKVILDPATRIRSLSDGVTYPVEIDPTVNVSVAAGADDGFEERKTSAFWNSSNTNNVFGRGNGSPGYDKHLGIRFQNVGVPQGATITSATLTVKTGYCNSGTVSGTLFGRLEENPGVFNSSNFPSQVARTSASVAAGPWSANTTYNIAVTNIVQELVNQSGFASGNAMGLMAINAETTYHIIYVEAFELPAGAPPALSVTYTAAGGTARNLLLLGCG